MPLTTKDFREFMGSDPADDETVPLGDALAEVAVDTDIDAVADVRDARERF
jgi:hypothetical protein